MDFANPFLLSRSDDRRNFCVRSCLHYRHCLVDPRLLEHAERPTGCQVRTSSAHAARHFTDASFPALVFLRSYNPAAAIMWDVLEVRTGDGRYACGFWIIPMFAQFLCATCSMTSNSRMLYAFSRDDAVPGSSFWHHINERVDIPVNAVGGSAFVLRQP